MPTGTFSYNFGANPTIDIPRLLCSDTVEFAPDGTTPIYIFADQEYLMFAFVVSQVWQSTQFFSGPLGIPTLPSPPVNYLRQAAYALNSLAANKSRLASVKKLLDVQMDSSDAAIQLRATADWYLTADDESGAMVIIEQVNDSWSFRDRYWKTVQRESAQGV